MANYGKDYTGQRFGRLTAKEKSLRTDKRGRFMWIFDCECGGQTTTFIDKVRSGHTQSCGCFSREQSGKVNLTHGQSKTPTYFVWKEMHQRCENSNHARYAQYGGRGITVCARWGTYENFIADMGDRPSDRHTLERKDNDGNYELDNCKWATYTEQRNNRSDYQRPEVVKRINVLETL